MWKVFACKHMNSSIIQYLYPKWMINEISHKTWTSANFLTWDFTAAEHYKTQNSYEVKGRTKRNQENYLGTWERKREKQTIFILELSSSWRSTTINYDKKEEKSSSNLNIEVIRIKMVQPHVSIFTTTCKAVNRKGGKKISLGIKIITETSRVIKIPFRA